MRLVLLTVLLTVMGPAARAAGEEPPFNAGVLRLTVADERPFDVIVWYPTRAVERARTIGPFTLSASDEGVPADGRFPLVLLSHGGGASGGSPLLLAGLSAALARSGVVVAAPFHARAGLPRRVAQVNRALDAVLADRRLASHVDPLRLGMLGFSLGGAVALEVAGAVPNPIHFAAYCSTHPLDAMSCAHRPDGGQPADQPTGSAPLPLRALVLLDPLAAPFQRDGLAALTMPIQLIRPDGSALPAEGNAAALAASLPQPPAERTVAGGHFIFVDPCTAALAAEAPEVCQDPPGVDRARVQEDIDGAIIRFLHDTL